MFTLTFDDTMIGKDNSSYKLDRISPSMLGSYLTCPLAFYYGYIAKIEMPTTKLHLLFGSAIHLAIENMYDGHPNPGQIFADKFKREDLDPEGQLSYQEYFLLGKEMVKNYLEFHPTIDKLYSLADGKQEFKFKMPLRHPITGEMTRVPISGILDRITNGGKIIEYKTSKTKWSADESRFKVQSLLYNLWYYTVHGEIADETLYLVLLKKYKQTSRDEIVQVISYKPTIEDLAAAWEEIDFILDKIESGNFERPSHGHKPYCDCYKYENLLNVSTNN